MREKKGWYWLNDQVYFLKMISIDRRGNVWLIVPKNSMLNGVVQLETLRLFGNDNFYVSRKLIKIIRFFNDSLHQLEIAVCTMRLLAKCSF